MALLVSAAYLHAQSGLFYDHTALDECYAVLKILARNLRSRSAFLASHQGHRRPVRDQ